MADIYRFAAYGPYPVPVERGRRRIDFESAKHSVMERFELDGTKRGVKGISNAIGCYVFGLSPSGTPKEWPCYVGQSAKQKLVDRIFQQADKPKLYNSIVSEYERARPFIYLLPLLTPAGRIARLGSNTKKIDEAEYLLIGMCLKTNPWLWNVKHRVGIESFSIDGTPEATRRESAASKKFRRMLNFDQTIAAARTITTNLADDVASDDQTTEESKVF